MSKDNDNQSAEAKTSAPAAPSRLQQQFEQEISGKVAEKFGLKNPMSQPKLEKIVLNVSVGRYLENGKLAANATESVVTTLTKVSGQKPILINAKKSVSNFKLREGMPSAYMVTMRRDKMWSFLDRLINLTTPRIKDFRGLPTKSFDKGGSYSMGLTEQAVFPEIDMGSTKFTHGMNINVVFSDSTPEVSRFVLEELGMPFKKKIEG
jgi:large subunit ribosomal protein L5